MLLRKDKNCAAGQGLACPFAFALCTPPGLNVVCAAGLVPASGGIVWGAGGWECRPCWEGASLFKLSLQPRLPAAERHGAGLGSRWVSRGCLGLGRAHSSGFLTARVSQELVTPRVAPLEGTWDCSTWLKGFRHARWHLPAQNHCTQTEIPALVCCLSEQVLSSCCPCSSHLGRPELFVHFWPLHALGRASCGCRICSSRSSPSSNHPSAGGGGWFSAHFCHPTVQLGDPCDALRAHPSQPAAVATHAPTSPCGGTREALCLASFGFLIKRHPDPYSQLSEQLQCLHFPFVGETAHQKHAGFPQRGHSGAGCRLHRQRAWAAPNPSRQPQTPKGNSFPCRQGNQPGRPSWRSGPRPHGSLPARRAPPGSCGFLGTNCSTGRGRRRYREV